MRILPLYYNIINHISHMYSHILQTTTGSLWVLYNLAKNPEVQEKLYRETQNILHDNEPITPEKLSQLSYVKAVVKETFRLVKTITKHKY